MIGDRYDPEPRSRKFYDMPKPTTAEYKDDFDDDEEQTSKPYKDDSPLVSLD